MLDRWARRREYQASLRLGKVIEYTCGCGAYVGQQNDEPEKCYECKRRKKIKEKHRIFIDYGFCHYCGDLAPGICNTCAGEIFKGRIPSLRFLKRR